MNKDVINRQRVINEFLELVQIDSPTREERVIGDLLKEKLKKLNCEVMEDNAGEAINGNCGNIFAFLKGNIPNAPCIMFSAHMDTVEPGRGIKPILKDNLITSDGNTILGADDKAGIVPILEGIRILQEQNIPHGDIQIVLCVAEEGGLNGSKNLDQNLLKADFGYVLDSEGNTGTITIKAPGQNTFTIEVYGRSAHAGISPEEGISAIIVSSKAVADMKLGKVDEETTANIGTIQGGIATNIIPDKVILTGEARSHKDIKLNNQTEHMIECFERNAKDMGASINVDLKRSYNSFSLDSNSQVVSVAARAASTCGLEPVFFTTGGGSDANYFNQYGIPTAVLGIGIQNFHTTMECIGVEDLIQTTNWVLEIIKEASSSIQKISL